MATYLIQGRRMTPEEPGFHDALAAAHAARHRPLCLCRSEGLPMYVARLGSGFILKRMPDTGDRHAADCSSYEPSPGLSGLGELGPAIVEDPADGVTSLKLGFPLSKGAARSATPGCGDGGDSVATDGTKLTLRGLLHYLWVQAGLTRWQPGFSGRRSWAVVRKHLLLAAEGKVVRGRALHDELYVPEVFSAERRDEIHARRGAHFSRAARPGQGSRSLMLLIGEVKEIVPARFGYKAVIKHVPDQAFALDEAPYRRMGRRFETELARWVASEDLHMVMMATFGVSTELLPTISELTLMPVTTNWIPVSDAFEHQLIERLVHEGRRFVKSLRYNLPADRPITSAVLIDTDSPMPLFAASPGDECSVARLEEFVAGESDPWIWHAGSEPVPALPPRTPNPRGEGVD